MTTAKFGKDNNCKVSRALLLCLPADKDDEEIVDEAGLPVTPLPVSGPPQGSMLCYKVRCPKPLSPRPDQAVIDQFGDHALSQLRAKLVCTPLEQPPTTITTTSSTTTSTSSTTSTTIVSGCFIDTGLTVIDTCNNLEWEKKNTLVYSGVDAGNRHDVDNLYSWAGECTIGGALCQPSAAAAATCAAQTGGALGCAECGGGEGTCDVDASDPGAITTIWDWVNQVNAAGYAGHTDWRLATTGGLGGLPTGEPAELESIVDLGAAGCGGGGPCIDSIFGPTVASVYWSASTVSGNQSLAWNIDFLTGSANLDCGKTCGRFTRAVRPGS